MIKVLHFEIRPNKEQEAKLFRILTLCRGLYNRALEERIKVYKETGKGITYYQQQNQLPKMKEEQPEYKEVPSQSLQDVLRRLDTAYKNFFDKRASYPKFKDKFHYSSFTIPQVDIERNFGEDGHIYIPKIGYVRMKAHREFNRDQVKIINIKYDGLKWFANLTEEDSKTIPLPKTGKSVGLDMGLKELVVASDGTMFHNPKWINKSEKKLKCLHRQLSRKSKGSNNKSKSKKKLAKLYSKVSNQRKDYLHKITFSIIKNYDFIAIENLQSTNMMKNHKLAKSIANASWNTIANFLSYKSLKYQKTLVKVNPQFTTQLCSQCGELSKKSLAVRTHNCPYCGLSLDRDVNAAINILRAGTAQIYACGDYVRPLTKRLRSSKQETPSS